MKVSIIIPVYNVEKYLYRCLNSVIQQTYKDLDIILIDDGSTDLSGEICDEYMEKDDRIVVVHQKNAGVANARNTGLLRAKGEGIMFIDADDYVGREHVMTLVNILKKTSVDMAVTSYKKVDNDSIVSVKNSSSKVEVFRAKEAIIMMLLSRKIDSCVCCKLIKKETINKTIFPCNQKIGEDMIFYYKLLKKMECIGFCDRKEYFYVQHEGGTINVINTDNIESLSVFETLINNEKNSDIRQALKCKYVSTCFHFLILAKRDGYNTDKLKGIIRRYRKELIVAKYVSIKVRIAILLSYISFDLVVKLWRGVLAK